MELNTPVTFKHVFIAAVVLVLYTLYQDHVQVNHIVQFLSRIG